MKLLITGIGGFSGSYLARHFLKNGHFVVGIGRSKIDPAFITSDLLYQKRFFFLQQDINTLEAIPSGKIDAIIHTAATSPTHNTKVHDFIHANVLATEKLVSLAKIAQVNHFIFFSSLSVYGEIKDFIVNEMTPILNPGPYGISKLFGEYCLREAEQEIPSIALRLPAVLGKGARRHWLANTLLRARKNELIKIFNPAALFNNAVHIQDLCQLIEILLQKPLVGFTPLTLGANSSLMIQAVIDTILSTIRSSSKITIDNKQHHSFIISNEKAKNDYHYNPQTLEAMLNLYLMEENNAL